MPIPYLRFRSSITKNKKEVKLPIDSETLSILRQIRPKEALSSDHVLRYRIPNSTRLQKDLQAVGVVYRMLEGDLDFHALRHTYITGLMAQGVPTQMVQFLARHEDANLSANRYTDVSQLPSAATVQKLVPLGASCTDICTDFTDFCGLSLSSAGNRVLSGREAQAAETDTLSHKLTVHVADHQQDGMVAGAGIEPAT